MSTPRDRQRGRRTCAGEVDALHLDQVWARALDRDLEDQEIEAEEPGTPKERKHYVNKGS